ncbi:SAM-dependent methyltransferase, partial [Mycobacterium tuberculosis]
MLLPRLFPSARRWLPAPGLALPLRALRFLPFLRASLFPGGALPSAPALVAPAPAAGFPLAPVPLLPPPS